MYVYQKKVKNNYGSINKWHTNGIKDLVNGYN